MVFLLRPGWLSVFSAGFADKTIMKRKIFPALSSPILWIIALSLIWTVVFALDLIPILRGGFDWDWHYKPMLERYRIAPLIIGVISYIPIGLWLRKQRSATGLLIWAILGGIFLTFGAVHVRGDILYRLYSLTVSGRTGGWHMAAARIQDLASTLHAWPQFMGESSSFTSHLDHSPPGIVIIYYLSSHLLEQLPKLADWLAQPVRWLLCQYLTGYTNGEYASAWIGMLMPVWGSLTILPLYHLGRRVFGEEAARWSVLWWPLVPSFLIFAPLPNTFYALPSLFVIIVLWNGLRNNQIGWVLAAGVLMSVLTFLTFTFTPLLLFAGLLTLGAYWLKSRSISVPRPPWHWPIQMGLWFGLGLSVVWLIFYAATGSWFWDIWQTAQQTQIDIAQIRPYWPWLALNLNDFFMFTGWPLTLLAALGCWWILRDIKSKKLPGESDIMILAAGLTIIILDLSGTPRGETGRILLFLSPWLLLAAAQTLGDHQRGGWVLTAVQGIIAIVMIVCLQVLAGEFRGRAAPVPPPVKYPASNPPLYSSDAVFNDTVRLTSFSGKIDTQISAQGTRQTFLYLWLTWEDLKSMDVPYAYMLRPVSPSGTVSSPMTILSPFMDAYPMTCWKPSDGQLTDRVKVPLPEMAAGQWWVDVSVVDPGTGQAVEVVTQDGSRNQHVRLGPFH